MHTGYVCSYFHANVCQCVLVNTCVDVHGNVHSMSTGVHMPKDHMIDVAWLGLFLEHVQGCFCAVFFECDCAGLCVCSVL